MSTVDIKWTSHYGKTSSSLYWVSEYGVIDISQFQHLKLRKDGYFDARMGADYYKDLKDYIKAKEKEKKDLVAIYSNKAIDNHKI